MPEVLLGEILGNQIGKNAIIHVKKVTKRHFLSFIEVSLKSGSLKLGFYCTIVTTCPNAKVSLKVG